MPYDVSFSLHCDWLHLRHGFVFACCAVDHGYLGGECWQWSLGLLGFRLFIRFHERRSRLKHIALHDQIMATVKDSIREQLTDQGYKVEFDGDEDLRDDDELLD